MILPWNAPLNQAARGIAPALAAGNTVVAKPSEFTSGSLLELARLAVEECGLPAGVVNVVTGTGPEAGAALVSHRDVRKVAFTGSVRAGREVGKIAAERIIPLTLELGGKSPDIVFADADLKQAVPGALRAFVFNSGQICTAGSRILVERPIHDAFVAGWSQALKGVSVGADDKADDRADDDRARSTRRCRSTTGSPARKAPSPLSAARFRRTPSFAKAGSSRRRFTPA